MFLLVYYNIFLDHVDDRLYVVCYLCAILFMMLINLPPEILVRIFLFLPLPGLLACQGVNYYLYNVISSSIELQYALHCKSATQLDTDSPHCLLSSKERMALLLDKEARWKELNHRFHSAANISFLTSGIYDLSGGVYLLGDVSRRTLHYTYLPNDSDQKLVWKSITTDHSIIDMGLCVHEHDLIVIITTCASLSYYQSD